MTHDRQKMARGLVASYLIAVSGLLSGCVGSTHGTRLSEYERTGHADYYVQRAEDDEKNLASAIRGALVARGLAATDGSIANTPPDLDFLVTYVAGWRWAFGDRLAELRIDVRDPLTHETLGFGETVQNSFEALGRTQDDVVELVLDELLTPRADRP